jgi:hypothetical protein
VKNAITAKCVARQSRNRSSEFSRKDAKAAKKIPLSSPFGKGGKRGILPKCRPADAVQDMLGARMILSRAFQAKEKRRLEICASRENSFA